MKLSFKLSLSGILLMGLLMVGTSASVAAPSIGIDPTGSGSNYLYADIWTNITDSGLAVGYQNSPTSTPYPITFITQARIGTMAKDGIPVTPYWLNAVPNPFFPSYELTYQTKFEEMVSSQSSYTDQTGIVHETANFESGENQASLINFYIDKFSDGSQANPNIVALYGDDDNIGPVMTAHLVKLQASFDFIKSGPNIGTGTGSYDVLFQIDNVNKSYIDVATGTIIGVKTTGSLNLPTLFNPTTMWDGTSTAAPNILFKIDGSETYVVGPPPTPKICIKKSTNGADANDPNGGDVPMITVGSQVTWDYEITNCGNVPVAKADVVVRDSQTGVTPAFASVVSGNNDDVLDPGEIWLYKATGTALDLLLPQPDATTVPDVCTHNGQLPPRTAYTNIGTVTIPGATASDPSSYCNPPAPCVTITKYTNGADADNPDAAGVPEIAKDQPVTWTFKVSNCGNISVAKADVVVTDNQPNVTPAFESELSGNGDSMFNPGEVWLYKATGTAINLLSPPPEVHVQAGVCTEGGTQPPRTAYVNIGTVTIPGASANNPSSYCNPKGPCVTIIKKTNGKDANDPNGANVPVLSTGAPVTWTYEITNCGNVSVASADVRVSDNQPGVTPSYTSGDANNNGMFDPGETWLYTANGTAFDMTDPPAGVQVQPGVCTQGGSVQFPSTAYVNIGTVTIPGASATDPSSYCNPPPVPCVRIVKKTNGADANNPDGADVPLISANDPVTWTYEVSNCGSLAVPMTQVTVTDDQGVIPVFDKVLSGNVDSYFDPGEVWQYKATGTALDLSSPPPFIKVQQGVCTHDHTQPPRTAYINIGTVTIPGATASDPSSYCNPQEPFGGCRMTGGNVTVDNAIVCNPWAVNNSKAKAPKNANQLYTSYTVGGQIGAPKAGCSDTLGAAFGEWTHTQHSGAEGSFTFHAGTHSAPDDAFIKCITCADPGWCTQARCAPFKQIFFEGTGVFKNERGFNFKVPATCSTGVIPFSDKKHTLHYFKAHVGDFGEPGNTGKQKSFDPNVCKWRSGGVDLANLVTLPSVPDPKFGDKGGQACDTCPDWYEIEIHCTADPSSEVIYRGAGFITGGNYQIHPEVGQQCPF